MSILRRELTEFVIAADELLASIGKVQLSPSERGIIEYYIREIPAKMDKGTA